MDKKTALDFLKMLDFCDEGTVWPQHVWKIRVRLEGIARHKLGIDDGE